MRAIVQQGPLSVQNADALTWTFMIRDHVSALCTKILYLQT